MDVMFPQQVDYVCPNRWGCLGRSVWISVFPKVSYLRSSFFFFLHQPPIFFYRFADDAALHFSLVPTQMLGKPLPTFIMNVLFLMHHLLPISDNYLLGKLPTVFVLVFPRLLFLLFRRTSFSLSSVKFWLGFSSFHWITSIIEFVHKFFSLLVFFILASVSRAVCKGTFLFRARRIFTPAYLLLCKDQIRPTLEYCVWNQSSTTFFLLDRVQWKAVGLIGDPSLISNQQSRNHRWAGAWLFFYRYYFWVSALLSSLQQLPFSWLSFFSYIGGQLSFIKSSSPDVEPPYFSLLFFSGVKISGTLFLSIFYQPKISIFLKPESISWILLKCPPRISVYSLTFGFGFIPFFCHKGAAVWRVVTACVVPQPNKPAKVAYLKPKA